jgi:hypothetical protein
LISEEVFLEAVAAEALTVAETLAVAAVIDFLE